MDAYEKKFLRWMFFGGKNCCVPYYLNISSLFSPTGDDVPSKSLEKVLKQVAKAAAAETETQRTHHFTTDQHRQKGRSFSNHASTIQTSHRMYDSKRTSQAHTRKATLCEGDKGRSGERKQITSQRQQVGTKPTGKIIVVQRPYSRGIYNF